MPDAAKVYETFRAGEAARVTIGGSYLIDSYKHGRASVEIPTAGRAFYRPGKFYPLRDAAWRAGRDAAKAGEPNPFQ